MRLSTLTHLVSKRKLTFASGLALAVFGLVAFSGVGITRASAADYSPNAIMHGGFSSPADFINKVRNNDDGAGHHDLQSVYHAYGLDPSEYSRFAANAKQGTAYKDGRIVVNGQVVATATHSIGRQASQQGSGYFSQPIGNEIFYGNTNDKAFASDALPVMVLFNAQGTMEFAVLNDCGNPMMGTNVVTAAACTMLNETAIPGKPNSYSFTTSASHVGNAAIVKLVYDFGDGSSYADATPSNPTPVHTYTKTGTYTVKVTVFASVPGNPVLQLPVVAQCTKTITVKIPYFQCVGLNGVFLDATKLKDSFTATAKYGNGAVLVSGDFTFGDGTSALHVKPTTATTITTPHTYAKAGTYDAVATLHFLSNGSAVSAPACKAVVTPTAPPTPECKPGIPVGDNRCNVCKEDNSLPADSPDCTTVAVTPPPTLPNTGAGDTIAIGAIVAVVGFMAYRQLLFRKHRAAFAAAERGTSPLPLGQPLDTEAPLTGTPLATKRGFRRRRPF